MIEFKVVKMLELDDVKEGFYWLLCTLGGMLPLWLLFLPLTAFAQPISLDAFAGNGEFALYSAAILSSAIYLLTKETKPIFAWTDKVDEDKRDLLHRLRVTFPGHRPLTILAVSLIVASAGVFIMTTTADLFAGFLPGLPMNKSFLPIFTVGTFIVSAALSFFITAVANASMNQPEFRRLSRADYEVLSEQFDRLNGGS